MPSDRNGSAKRRRRREVRFADENVRRYGSPPVVEMFPAAKREGTRLVGAIVLALVATGCASHISRQELWRRIEAGDAPPIVDVRSDSEYEKAHVPGAVHVPFWLVWPRLDEVPKTTGEPLVVYCEHGPRAGMANFALWIAGRGPVVYLDGHMSSWKRDGLPTESGADPSGNATSRDAP